MFMFFCFGIAVHAYTEFLTSALKSKTYKARVRNSV